MAQQLDVKVLGGTQIAVGLSAIVAVRPSAMQIAYSFKIVSGAGTLWVSPVPPALTGSSAAPLIATGYPVASTEIYNVGGAACFYLSASSATMVVGMALGYTTGYTSI